MGVGVCLITFLNGGASSLTLPSFLPSFPLSLPPSLPVPGKVSSLRRRTLSSTNSTTTTHFSLTTPAKDSSLVPWGKNFPPQYLELTPNSPPSDTTASYWEHQYSLYRDISESCSELQMYSVVVCVPRRVCAGIILYRRTECIYIIYELMNV